MSDSHNLVDELDQRYYEVENVSAGRSISAEKSTSLPLRKDIEYLNSTGADITITDRDSIPFIIKPDYNRDMLLVIQVTYTVGPSTLIDPKSLSKLLGKPTTEREAWNKTIEEAESGEYKTTSNRVLRVTYKISRQTIERHKALYIPELDILVSLYQTNDSMIHPYSDLGDRYKLIESDINLRSTKSFGYSMYIVSNDGDYGDRYINLGGKVFKVPSTVNHSLQNGVYVCSSGDVVGKHSNPTPLSEFYTFEQAEEQLTLYQSTEEARIHGDLLGSQEYDRKQQAADLEDLKIQAKKKQLEHEERILAKKREQEETELIRQEVLAQQQHERAMRAIADKDYYESRQHARKDSSELIKYIPVVITAGLAIITLIQKYSKD